MASQTFATASGGATLTLNEYASQINGVTGLLGAATSIAGTAAAIVTAAPTGTQAQFTGTAQTPKKTVVLGASWLTGSIVTVDYEPADETVANI